MSINSAIQKIDKDEKNKYILTTMGNIYFDIYFDIILAIYIYLKSKI